MAAVLLICSCAHPPIDGQSLGPRCVPPANVRVLRAQSVNPSLAGPRNAGLVLRVVVPAWNTRAVTPANVFLRDHAGTNRYRTDSNGVLNYRQLRPGKIDIFVGKLRYWPDSATVVLRAGFVDTLDVVLSEASFCETTVVG
jgi:hypothetical protein